MVRNGHGRSGLASRHGLVIVRTKRAIPRKKTEKPRSGFGRVSVFMSLFSFQLVIREDMQLSLCLVAIDSNVSKR